ncbi:MAG: DUF5666 domain-containing protein [Candidatus Binatia bacterium]
MMNREIPWPHRWLSLGLAVLVFASPALAHGGIKHVLGTVKEIAADHLVVETRSGEMRNVAVSGDTVYEREGAKADRSDLRVGDRVAVHFTKTDGNVIAKLIRLAGPKTAPKAVAPTKP